MSKGHWLLNGVLEFSNRKEFAGFLVDYIHDNELYNLKWLVGFDDTDDVEIRNEVIRRNAMHHPNRLAREIFGEDSLEHI